MQRLKSRLGPAAAALVLPAVLAVFLSAGCDTEALVWTWWTAEDSAAVAAELAEWRGTLDASQMLAGSPTGTWRGTLSPQDSTSETGDTLYKFARLLGIRFETAQCEHRDEYEFDVTVDSIAMTDTFCEVGYHDSMLGCTAHFDYDSLWVVGFRPETTVVETLVPPETTIVLAVSYTELRGFATTQTKSKHYDWSAFRKVFLARDGGDYELTKTTGFATYVPEAEDAPGVSSTGVILTRPGRVDTIAYAAGEEERNLYNLVHVDSLYTVEVGEEIQLDIATTTPADTTMDKNLFFLGIEGSKYDITTSARSGSGTFTFGTTGYHHVYVEILPLSSVLYPETDYAGTVWAIPVLVRDVE